MRLTFAVAGNPYNHLTIGGDTPIHRIGIGTNRIDIGTESKAVLTAAIDRAVNFIDTADIYTGGGSEQVVGAVAGGREGVCIATKGGYHGAAPDVMAAAIDKSLQRLGVNTIGLYLLHRPDTKHPIAQSVEPILRARDAGKVRHLGLSNVSLKQIQEVEKLSPVAAVENVYNLNDQSNDEVVDYCAANGIAFVAYFPFRGSSKAQAVADRHGATPHQVVLSALLARASVMVPIPGTLSTRHLESNLKAYDLELTEQDLAELGIKRG